MQHYSRDNKMILFRYISSKMQHYSHDKKMSLFRYISNKMQHYSRDKKMSLFRYISNKMQHYSHDKKMSLFRYISNKMQTLLNLYISGNCSTFFGWYLHPSSEAHTTVSTASGTGQTVSAPFRYRGTVGTAVTTLPQLQQVADTF